MKILDWKQFVSEKLNIQPVTKGSFRSVPYVFYVYENNSGKYSTKLFITKNKVGWNDVKLLERFKTFQEAYNYAVDNSDDIAYAYDIVDELMQLVKLDEEQLLESDYRIINPYHKGFAFSTESNKIIATTYNDYLNMVNDLKSYGGKERVFYFEGKPFTGKASYIRGYNGYSYAENNGLLCALIDNSLWDEKGNPNALVDNNGKNIVYPYMGNDEGATVRFKNGVFVLPKYPKKDDQIISHLESIVMNNKQWVDLGGNVLWRNKNEESKRLVTKKMIGGFASHLPTKEDFEELVDTCDVIIGKFDDKDGVYLYNSTMDAAIFLSFGIDNKFAVYPSSTKYDAYGNDYYFLLVSSHQSVNIAAYDIDDYTTQKNVQKRYVKRK